MENKPYALAAGLFTLLLTAAILVAAVWFSGEAVETQDYLLVSRYPVSGLNAQAAVRYRGVAVGKVTSIEFDLLDPPAILITIAVRTGTPLTQGTYAQLGSQGVTGLSYVMLDDDGRNPAPLAGEGGAMPRIPVRPSFMDTLAGSGQELVATAGAVAKRLDRLLDDKNQAQLLRTLATVEQATHQLAQLSEQAAPAIKALPAAIHDARMALQRADALMAKLSERAEAVDRAVAAVEQVGAATTAVADSLVRDSLPRINLLVDDLQRTSRNLDRVLESIHDQPSSLVFGKAPAAPGPGETGYQTVQGVRR
jgi:phospholipid/cholesterol/gamma-HCH transport system substrate-binding protein